jgi:hypothetical protein
LIGVQGGEVPEGPSHLGVIDPESVAPDRENTLIVALRLTTPLPNVGYHGQIMETLSHGEVVLAQDSLTDGKGALIV